MPKAIWNGVVIAESDHVEEMEGNYYFPPETVRKKLLKPSDVTTVCPWKGTASYYDIEIEGKAGKEIAWYYPDPKEAAMNIKDHVAFWRGVVIEE